MSLDNLETVTEGSVLQKGAEIRGNIRTEKSIFLKGMIVGDVECKGKLVIGTGGMIEGNISCRELVSDGVIAGDVSVEGKASLMQNAVIKGYLITSCILLHPVAVIEKGLRLKDKQ